MRRLTTITADLLTALGIVFLVPLWVFLWLVGGAKGGWK